MICRHCNKNKVNRPLGLCWSCYYTPGVRALYPSTSKYTGYDHLADMTEAELDALIAEQRKTMPQEFKFECRNAHGETVTPRKRDRTVKLSRRKKPMRRMG